MLASNLKKEDLLLNYISNNKIIRLSRTGLPNNTLWKKDAIKVNFKYDNTQSDFRLLNDTEINKLIDEYEAVDGLYKLEEWYDNKKRTVFVSIDYLYNYLKKNYYMSLIVFKFTICIKEEDILLID